MLSTLCFEPSARTIVVDCGVAVTYRPPHVTRRSPRRIGRPFEGYGRSLRTVHGVRREAAAVVTFGRLRRQVPLWATVTDRSIAYRPPSMVYFVIRYIRVENVKNQNKRVPIVVTYDYAMAVSSRCLTSHAKAYAVIGGFFFFIAFV